MNGAKDLSQARASHKRTEHDTRFDCEISRSARNGGPLFLNELGVLEHRDPATLGQFAFERDDFAAGIGQLVVHRFVLAHDEIGLAVFDNPNRAAVLDAFRAASGAVTFAHRVMVHVAHHVDDFAGDRFLASGL